MLGDTVDNSAFMKSRDFVMCHIDIGNHFLDAEFPIGKIHSQCHTQEENQHHNNENQKRRIVKKDDFVISDS